MNYSMVIRIMLFFFFSLFTSVGVGGVTGGVGGVVAHGRQNEGDELLERVGRDSSEHFAANPLFFSMSVLSPALQCFSPESISTNWNPSSEEQLLSAHF